MSLRVPICGVGRTTGRSQIVIDLDTCHDGIELPLRQVGGEYGMDIAWRRNSRLAPNHNLDRSAQETAVQKSHGLPRHGDRSYRPEIVVAFGELIDITSRDNFDRPGTS